MIHLNNAGAALAPAAVQSAICEHIRLEGVVGPYAAAEQRRVDLDRVYADAARLIGAQPDEVALMPGGSAAWNAGFYGLRLRPGERVLTTSVEYGGAVAAMRQRERQDRVILDVAPARADGRVDLEALEALIRPSTRVLSLTWVPTHCGIEEPVQDVAAIAKRHGLIFMLDAAQTLGQRPIDVERIGCDVLAASTRKFLRGPRGLGLLYVRRGAAVEPAHVDHWSRDPRPAGHAEPDPAGARRFELWERPIALQLGLGAAISLALLSDLHETRRVSERAADRLRRGLRSLERVRLGDPPGATAPIVSFGIRGMPAQEAHRRLAERGVQLSVTSHRSAPLSTGLLQTEALVRASPHDDTTDGMIDAALAQIDALAKARI